MENFLDLSNVKCPMNFVQIKLKIEELQRGDILTVKVTDPVAVQDIPRSLEEEQHTVEDIQEEGSSYIMTIKV